MPILRNIDVSQSVLTIGVFGEICSKEKKTCEIRIYSLILSGQCRSENLKRIMEEDNLNEHN